MCGICGIVSIDGGPLDGERTVRSMMQALVHRGPDDEGIYVGDRAVLGHRRLSIIDLESGHQPISNEDGSVWIVFNGEIYNYRELRADLLARGHVFRTNTDTEVIVHLYEEHGRDCVTRLNGMFALAIWDDRNKTLMLSRDRVGIKPLYYTKNGGNLSFASEIKALLTDRRIPRKVNLAAMDAGLSHLFGAGPETLLDGIFKLLPGHTLVVSDSKVREFEYWDLRFGTSEEQENEAAITESLDRLLEDVVAGHMISDVPVGVLLSGGVDSTAMLSYAAQQTNQRIKTFTVGFSGAEFADERPFARLAAQSFGSEHHEITVSSDQFRDFLAGYVWHMEELICEPPAIALHYVTQLARQHVKVLISGEGGDEAFAGYQNYRNLLWLERIKKLGPIVSGAVALGFDALGAIQRHPRWPRFARALREPLSGYYQSRTSGRPDNHHGQRSHLYSAGLLAELQATDTNRYFRTLFDRVATQPPLNQMLYVDSKSWLPDDLLVKADKITMASSVELRVPLLDHRILEFAASLPTRWKVRGMETKYILKRTLRSRVPQEILRRPKTGFPVPYETWMRGDLRDYVRSLLLDQRTINRGYFVSGAVRALVSRFEAGAPLGPEVFSLVTLELWHRQFIDPSTSRMDHLRQTGS
jgi:asparagine synthase (glutamine-hydrolysing)